MGNRIVGSAERICLASKQWSDPVPYCEGKIFDTRVLFTLHLCTVVDCGSLTVQSSELGGLTLSILFTTYNSTISYRCTYEGYQLVGTAARICQANGNWSDQEPSCGSEMILP